MSCYPSGSGCVNNSPGVALVTRRDPAEGLQIAAQTREESSALAVSSIPVSAAL